VVRVVNVLFLRGGEGGHGLSRESNWKQNEKGKDRARRKEKDVKREGEAFFKSFGSRCRLKGSIKLQSLCQSLDFNSLFFVSYLKLWPQ
jgi:hypothetical protein